MYSLYERSLTTDILSFDSNISNDFSIKPGL